MFVVELDIFSGRPNPSWQLNTAEQRELLDRILSGTVPMAPATSTDGALGYRGFVVTADGAEAQALADRGLATTFRVRDGLGSLADLATETWLLYTGEAIPIPGAAAGSVRSALSEPSREIAACTLHKTSTTNLEKWNGSHQFSNNCYNFGSNFITDTFAQPGRGTGDMYDAINVEEIEAAAVRDGYEYECHSGNSLAVGFAIWPNADYHWWRQTKPMDGEVRWCHKPGGSPARNTDDSGKFITDPSTADRGPYTVWGGFLWSPSKKRKTVI